MDRTAWDFRLQDDSPALKLGFKQIPMDEIGPYADEYRRAVPRREPLALTPTAPQ